MPHREGKDALNAGKEASKLNKTWVRGHINTGEVKILTHYFLVNKGEDIRKYTMGSQVV